MQKIIKRVDSALDYFWIDLVHARVTSVRVAFHEAASKYYLNKMNRSRGMNVKVEAARMKSRKHAVYAEIVAKI